MDIHDLIQELDQCSAADIPDVAAHLLTRPGLWRTRIGAYLESLGDNEFVELVSKSYVPDVEPAAFMLHDDPAGRFRLVLGHFDRTRFHRCRENGKVGPHHHHFTFTTRILAGDYQNVLYENTGTLARPHLRAQTVFTCQEGDTYTLPFDWYHMVMEPQHHTMSLMIRGPAECPQNNRPMGLTTSQLRKHRQMLGDLLVQPESHAAGARIDLKEMCRLGREILE